MSVTTAIPQEWNMKRLTRPAAAALIDNIRRKHPIRKGFDIRLARLDDVPELLAVGRACFSYNPPTRRELRYAIAGGHMMIVILSEKKSGRIAGFDIYEFNRRTRAMYFSLTCLLPEFRGKGLSHTLLAVCHAVAAGAGCRSIRTHVAENNRAMIYLLESYGHVRGERHKNYYSDKKAALTYRLLLGEPS